MGADHTLTDARRLCDAGLVPKPFPRGAELTVDQLSDRPQSHLAELRAHEPVSWVPAVGAWLVTRYDLALAVMHDADTFTVDDPRFSTARVVGPSMLSLDGDAHAANRAPFADPLRARPVRERFTAVIVEEIGRLLDELAPAGGAEMRRGFAGRLAANVLANALGLPADRGQVLLGLYDRIVAGVTAISAGEELPARALKAFTGLAHMLQEALGAGEDGGVLKAAATGSDLSAEELVSNAAVLLFGGIETMEGMITNALLALLEHGEAVAQVRARPELADAAVEDSLRLEPAAAAVDRYATADTTLGDASICRGDLVRVSLSAANRDPAVFENPDSYDLARPNVRRHLSFAAGPHVCLGVHLARLEARLALRAVLERFAGVRLDPDEPSAVSGLVFRKPQALHVVW
jgi:cytochrome P450